MHWNAQGDGIVVGGELSRDRSFQQTTTFWLPIENGGTVTFSSATGDPSPAGGNAADGFAELTRVAIGATCVYQVLLAGLQNTAFSIYFSANTASDAVTFSFRAWLTLTGLSPCGLYALAGARILRSRVVLLIAGTVQQGNSTRIPQKNAAPVKSDEMPQRKGNSCRKR